MNEHEMEEALSTVLRCPREAVRDLLPIFSWKRLSAKQVLASQGEISRQCWILIEGAVRAETIGANGQLQQLAQYGPGEFFGAYPEATVHRADICAASRSLLLCCDAPRLVAAVERQVDLAAGMVRLLARQLDRTLDRMVMRSTYSAAGRVYAELLALAGSALTLTPPPRVTALALAANTTRETASRALAVLVRRGIVTRDDTSLVIHSPRMIEELIC
ncbi:Crp/Fnr family transcriptional regulator [Novosphingobium mangrovi (ex Hu et al. 2023)]|uniref:Crp/Fnr family transcriptional regulator n=1 Tax=Novosphingobium mangrovi (ex Hu et al. 2023) TaxID=2930094 RepID=A0ABT0ACA4_9SPHN|nr:Crp/Fnr family transcriptional regulator [Novosphingobium mangrovi (ex Hu et al. 2023)]MCJ1960833.1 Crp/Fnr family transcriptional regulator [Novosphingobium mangrovi (ex Hu et al. 2023)]